MNARKITAFVLAAFLALSSGVPGFAAETDDIARSRKTITESKQKLEKAKSEKSKADAELKKLESMKSDAAGYIEEIDGSLNELKARIASLEEDIAEAEAAVETVKADCEASLEKAEKQRQSMEVRIRYMYEHSSADTLEGLLSCRSVADILNRVEYIRKVSEYDRQKLEEYREITAENNKKKEELTDALALLNEQKEVLDSEKKELQSLQETKQKELSEYEARITSEENEISRLEQDIAGISKAIKQEEASIAAIEAELKRKEEEARKKALAEGKTYEAKTIGNISFAWPCPASSRITSYFGTREAPVAGASTTHKGIDIGAPSGNKILAAADGEVVIATYSASAGNYVMISHGGDVCTVYMHMSEIKVKSGSVKKGDVIGLVGSTGYSTGPHLHFGIRVNGSYVDPLAYVSP